MVNWLTFINSGWAIILAALGLISLGSLVGTNFAGEWFLLWPWITAMVSGLLTKWTWMTSTPALVWSAIGALINLGLGILAYKAFQEARRSAVATQIQAEAALLAAQQSREALLAARVPKLAFHLKFAGDKFVIFATNYSEKAIVLDGLLIVLNSAKYSSAFIPDSDWHFLGIESAERRLMPPGEEVRFLSAFGNPTFRGELMSTYSYVVTHDFTYAGEKHFVRLNIRIDGTRVEVDDEAVQSGSAPES